MRHSWLIAMLLSSLLLRASDLGTATRLVPASVQAGTSFGWTNQITPAAGVAVYAVEEDLPTGWTASGINLAGKFDAATGKIKWGPFFDGTARQLTATVTIPSQASGIAALNGTVSFNGVGFAIGGASQIQVLPLTGSGTVVCAMPGQFLPGSSFNITNLTTPAPGVTVYAVEDQIPNGWTVSNISNGGGYDTVHQKIKWGPFFDATPRALTYTVQTPTNASGVSIFSGTGSFDGVNLPITGTRQTTAVASRALRTLPDAFVPGQALTVSIDITLNGTVNVYALEESIPTNWTLGTISDSGTFDSATGKIKWGPFLDGNNRTLSYQITPPASLEGAVGFAGSVSFDGFIETILGDQIIAGPVSQVTRSMPATVLSGGSFVLTEQAEPGPSVEVYAIEEQLPTNWVASNIDNGGLFDSNAGVIRWGPFFDASPRTLHCAITVPAGVSGVGVFGGTASFDGRSTAIIGAQSIMVQGAADANSASRVVPDSARAGGQFGWTNIVTVAANVGVWALEEQLPGGWTASSVSDGGIYDTLTGKVKWGPYFDALSRNVHCLITLPTSATGTVALIGQASFDGVSVAIGGRGSLRVIPDHPPVAQPDSYPRLFGQPASIPVSVLLSNDSDPENDPLTVTAVSALSANGFPVNLAGGVVTYTPSTNYHGSDSFTYTVSDGYGGQATGTVTLNELNNGLSQNVKLETVSTNGTVKLRFGGIPGFNYTVEATASLEPPSWFILGHAAAGSNGEFEFTDTGAIGQPARYYRSVYP